MLNMDTFDLSNPGHLDPIKSGLILIMPVTIHTDAKMNEYENSKCFYFKL